MLQRIRSFRMRQINENESLPPDKQMPKLLFHTPILHTTIMWECYFSMKNYEFLLTKSVWMWAYVVFVWTVASFSVAAFYVTSKSSHNHMKYILFDLYWMNQSAHFPINYSKIFIFVWNKIISCRRFPMG